MYLKVLRRLATFAILSLTLVACKETSSETPPVVIIDNFDGGMFDGCVQPTFPEAQPDLFVLSPPRFLLTNSISENSSTGQAQVDPGEMIEAQIAVNAATRQVKVEIADAWTPGRIIYAEDFQTAGYEVIRFTFASGQSTRGRFYMKVTLCTSECRDTEVVYDIIECAPDQQTFCGINEPYERTLLEDGEVVQVDATCIQLSAEPGLGSGTVVIQ